jgi:hypothetical protein
MTLKTGKKNGKINILILPCCNAEDRFICTTTAYAACLRLVAIPP